MTYQVLARKWRPKTFEQLVGQQHVVKALVNSIGSDRLHHAYLFTGTRGVGKTTIARVFAKALNCEQGPTANPCLKCKTCCAIDDGSYLDLIEVDAASRTRVEDTKEILDNVQYSPTEGRYKIYLIDEIHMLSGHSFNALLKTLEEPPAHVIFLLATTDPQKIPVTVLSRCIQFHLKPLSVIDITNYLAQVSEGEALKSDNNGLELLAKAAKGSLRDGLSLLDQAIAFASGQVNASNVRAMLGISDEQTLFELLAAILERNASKVLDICKTMAAEGLDYVLVLERLIDIIHTIALAQLSDKEANFSEQVIFFAQHCTKEDIQLYYEILLKARHDLNMAPIASIGFEMAMIRLMTFSLSTPAKQAPPVLEENITGSKSPCSEFNRALEVETSTRQYMEEVPKAGPDSFDTEQINNTDSAINGEPQIDNKDRKELLPVQMEQEKLSSDNSLLDSKELQWHDIVQKLSLAGIAKTVVMHCNLIEKNDREIILAIESAYQAMLTSSAKAAIQSALEKLFCSQLKVSFEVNEQEIGDTPAARQAQQEKSMLEQAKGRLKEDECLNEILNQFDVEVDENDVELK